MGKVRIPEQSLDAFVVDVFVRLGVSLPKAQRAARSLLDASLLGIDTHGITALRMYVNHIRAGGLEAAAEPARIGGRGAVETWDMNHGLGLAAGRELMTHAVRAAPRHGVHLLTCRNANHLGACGVYAKLAADTGLVGIVSQQARASLSPWGGCEPRVGASPFACVAPVHDAFPFYFDASMASMARAQVKGLMRAGRPLPAGVGLDAGGEPTLDPAEAWHGQLLPIGRHKGVGLAMVFEVLTSVLSANRLAIDIPSIVENPERSADSSLFMAVIDPAALIPDGDFAGRMREYVESIESSGPRVASDPPRYPGRREGECWHDRRRNGIPMDAEGLDALHAIADDFGLSPPGNSPAGPS